MTQEAAKGRHLGIRMEGNQWEQPRDTAALAGGLKAVGDRHNVTGSLVQPKPVHEQLQQTCVMDARQNTIASGSCCCSPPADSRSLAEYRMECLAATAHSTTGRHGSELDESALVKGSCIRRCGR